MLYLKFNERLAYFYWNISAFISKEDLVIGILSAWKSTGSPEDTWNVIQSIDTRLNASWSQIKFEILAWMPNFRVKLNMSKVPVRNFQVINRTFCTAIENTYCHNICDRPSTDLKVMRDFIHSFIYIRKSDI